MKSYDALIIGGGPAGSTCAWRLVQAGMKVVVLDKKEFPRNKPCAGWVTPPVVELLELDVEDYAKGREFQEITGFSCGTIGGKEVRAGYGHIVSYGILRRQFDEYLLRRCGADLALGKPMKSLDRKDGRWIANGEIAAPVVIGAGGHFCPVARRLGARRDPSASVVRAQEVEFEASPEELARGTVEAKTPQLYFCRDLMGYGWCFRKGNHLNIGLGRLSADGLAGHVAGLCEFLRERGKVVCEIPDRFYGHAYQLYEYVQPRLVDDGVLLIGDAAGLAYPLSGEGIRPAVESAFLAADVIRQNNGRYSAADLAPYADRILDRYGRPNRPANISFLPKPWLYAAAARLFATRWFARRIVFENWFLHTHEKPLVV